MQLAIGIVLATLIAAAAYRARALDISGSVAALAVGAVTFGLGGWSFALPLLTFFISSTFLSRWRRRSKEALGFEKGVSRSFREAPIFLGIFTFLVAVGAAIAIVPNLPLIRVLLVTQVINGLLLPIVLFAVLKLVNNREVMGQYVNGPLYNIAAWLTAIVVTILSLLFILISLFPTVFGHR